MAFDQRQLIIPDLYKKKAQGIPITSIGVFDTQTARIADSVGIDMLIIGDAGGICMLGYDRMNSIPLDDMIMMTKAVARGTKRGLVVTDMPYMTYHYSVEDGIRNSARCISEGGARAVKCEGNAAIAEKYVKPIADAGIPVMAHIGVEGFKISAHGARAHGKTAKEAHELVADAKAMEEAGCFAIIAEVMTPEVTGYIRRAVSIPIISLGSGTDADGVYIISCDMLHMCGERTPRTAKVYADVSAVIDKAFREYVDDINQKRYPGPDNCVPMVAEEKEKFFAEVGALQHA